MKEVALLNRIEVPSSEGLTIRETIQDIRARLNGVFFTNTEKHMLPHWVISRLWEGGRKKDAPTFFPNNTFRNWALIGTPGGQNFGIADSHGLTTVLEICGSIELWPKDSGIIYPAMLDSKESPFRLISIEDQMYEWSMTLGSITFQRLIYHVETEGQEYVINEINLQNVALDKKEFTFFFALRPHSVVGALPISSLSYDPSSLCLYSNDFLAVKLDRPPTALVMTSFDDPNLERALEEKDRIDKDFTSARGTGTSVARFDIKLNPAGRERLIFVSPLIHNPREKAISEPSSFYGQREAAISKWFAFTDEAPFGEYPEEELGYAAAQATVSIVVQIRRMISTQSAEDTLKQSGEIARIILAIALSGYREYAATALTELVSKFQDETYVASNVISLSPILWVINQIETLSSKSVWCETIQRFKDMMNELVEREIHRFNASDAFVPTDATTSPPEANEIKFNDIPSIESIKREASLPTQAQPERKITLKEILGRYWIFLSTRRINDMNEDFIRAVESYRSQLELSCKEILKTKSWDYESIEDLETIFEVISAYTLSKNFEIGKELLETLVSGVREKRFFRGLIRYPGKEAKISSHHALRIAQAFVLLGTRHEAELILGRVSDYLSKFHTLPDWIDPTTRGGTRGSGCSINAATDLKLLLRDMMAYVQGNDLYIFPGIPEDWFTSERSLSVSDFPTHLGLLSLSTGVSANQHQIEIQMERLPEEMEVFLPSHIPLHMVKVFGGTVIERLETPNNRIRMIPLSDQIAITFHRQ